MPDPSQLTPGAVEIPGPVVREAVVNEDATAEAQEVRCVLPGFSEIHATDPLPWTPYVGADGIFYPKKGDRAIVADPDFGPPVILEWWPKATEPDHPFS